MFDIAQILTDAYKLRIAHVKKRKLEAWRLYDKEDFDLPLGIDIYKNNAVIFLFAPIDESTQEEVERFLSENLHIHKFFYKNKQGGMKSSVEEKKTPLNTEMITISEYGNDFLINLTDYMDTGLFLDHRETRHWIGEKSRGKVVLNTFAYTGSFSVYAAKAGATKTYSVDLSKTYCDWIKKNIELNHLPLDKNWVYKMETFEFFKYAQRKELRFDIIIIDPPTFSRHQGKNFSVERDHPLLINAALELLNPGGFILFSNNKRGFKIKKNELTPCHIQNFKNQTWPIDFTDPETHHCFLIEAM